MTALVIGTMIAGAAMKAKSQWSEGNAAMKAGEGQRDVAESQASLSDYNAQVADLQAKDALERGAEEESRFRIGVRDLVGKQRTGFAASGIDVGYGSAVDVQADTAFLGELDARTIRTNAMREAWGFNVQGEDLRRRAVISRMEGQQALEEGKARRSAGRWGAVTSLVGAGGDLMLRKYGMSDGDSGAGLGGRLPSRQTVPTSSGGLPTSSGLQR